MAGHRTGMGAVGVLVQLRYVDANGGQVIYIQESLLGVPVPQIVTVFSPATFAS